MPELLLNETLRDQLSNLIRDNVRAAQAPEPRFRSILAPDPLRGVDPAARLNVVVTANEVTDLHGTGPLVKRICEGWPNIFSIRARDDWGIQDFGHWNARLSPHGRNRADFFHSALSVLRGRSVDTALCVPFLADELFTSIAIHECMGAKLCCYLMDDQNIACQNIPDALMGEFLQRCTLRLATHPELKAAYEQKYGLPFHVLPAIVPGELVATEPTAPPPVSEGSRRGALIGSFWDQSWYDRLCAVLSGCECRTDWFGNNKSPWFDLSEKSLLSAGIVAHGIVPEQRLARELKNYPFVIVPVGSWDDMESNKGVAKLSLPGRILFATATSHTPLLIVGSSRTCAARFVEHFGIGEVVRYDAAQVCAAMDRMSAPEAQRRMRQAAARIAPALSGAGISNWLARSIELGGPADGRFEELFGGYGATLDTAGTIPVASAFGASRSTRQ